MARSGGMLSNSDPKILLTKIPAQQISNPLVVIDQQNMRRIVGQAIHLCYGLILRLVLTVVTVKGYFQR